jgi:hypothetical protein
MSPWSSSDPTTGVIVNGSSLERLLLVRAKRATRRCGRTIRAWQRADSSDHAADSVRCSHAHMPLSARSGKALGVAADPRVHRC